MYDIDVVGLRLCLSGAAAGPRARVHSGTVSIVVGRSSGRGCRKPCSHMCVHRRFDNSVTACGVVLGVLRLVVTTAETSCPEVCVW